MKNNWLAFLFINIYCFTGYSQQNITTLEYIQNYKDEAIKEMRLNGIPASITLAQGILESNSGNSKLAKEANNHFGIKCHTTWMGETYFQDDDAKNECFRKYISVYDSYKDHSLFLTTRERYTFLFSLPVTDYKAWANGLKQAGYATNPKYPDLLIGLIERYELYKFDDANFVVEKQADKKEPTKNKSSKKKRTSKDNYILQEVVIQGREILKNNRVPYVIVKNDDSIEQICRDLQMMPWQIYKYNDLKKESSIIPGQRLYIKPKRNKHLDKIYNANEGETLRILSDKFAVKLKKLCKYNNIPSDQLLVEGQAVWLKKPSK